MMFVSWNDPPPTSFNPKSLDQWKKPKKQPPLIPQPSDSRIAPKRKVPYSQSEPTTKQPTFKIKLNLHLNHLFVPSHKNLCLRFLSSPNHNQPHPWRNNNLMFRFLKLIPPTFTFSSISTSISTSLTLSSTQTCFTPFKQEGSWCFHY